ncbi:MAG: 23S rRNA (guanosine(2251)-2'-O)-methyltransferase RlmB [Saprospiraceae bacterium]
MKDNNNIIYGRHPIIDAIQSGQTIDKILLQQGTRGDFEKEIRHLSKAYNIPVQVVPKEKLQQFTKGNHQGIVGFVSLVQYFHLEDVLPGIFEKSETPLILLLDGVTDVRNFGAIARSAEVAGAQTIVVPLKGSALINAEAMKTSAGALAKIPVCRETSLAKAIEYLKLSGIQILASDLQATKMIYELDFQQPTAIIIGSEGEGVNPALLREADALFKIPQVGTTDSFNVSVATGIILYEAMRQRLS